jgi:hypothetical protein
MPWQAHRRQLQLPTLPVTGNTTPVMKPEHTGDARNT